MLSYDFQVGVHQKKNQEEMDLCVTCAKVGLNSKNCIKKLTILGKPVVDVLNEVLGLKVWLTLTSLVSVILTRMKLNST